MQMNHGHRGWARLRRNWERVGTGSGDEGAPGWGGGYQHGEEALPRGRGHHRRVRAPPRGWRHQRLLRSGPGIVIGSGQHHGVGVVVIR